VKVQANPDSGFKPVVLHITLETSDEIEAFYAIMNHARVCDSVGFGDQSDQIRNELNRTQSGGVQQHKKFELLTKALNKTCS
jgi:hypothetical protein